MCITYCPYAALLLQHPGSAKFNNCYASLYTLHRIRWELKGTWARGLRSQAARCACAVLPFRAARRVLSRFLLLVACSVSRSPCVDNGSWRWALGVDY